MEGPINRISQIYSVEDIQSIQNKGSGGSVYLLIKEIFDTGKSTTVEIRNKNPIELSIKLFQNVWGIGAVTAKKLVQSHGLRDIEQLREAVRKGSINLERGQKIGLERFEDFNLRIPRSEVEEINAVVMEYAEKIVPGVQGTVCGSYRRGKTDCGDVDVLFIPPLGDEIMKKSFLSELVQTLAKGIYYFRLILLQTLILILR